jgi:hypothetical protein
MLRQALAVSGLHCYRDRMAKNDLRALREMIAEAQHILKTVNLPEGRAERASELLASAVFLADHLLQISPAAVLGAKGGKKTAKRGSEYFRQIAAKRKTRGGGRPKRDIN